MTDDIVKEINKQSLGSDEGIVNLYDLTVGGVTNYFHGENTDSPLRFLSRDYQPFPMMIEGIEVTGDGASPRPTLTLPNVNSLFRSDSELTISKIEDLVGGKVVRHQTLSKYVGIGAGSGNDATNNYELPKATYIIDRVASKNRLMVQLELASPFDLSGVRVPSRQVTGKYCAWVYKGYDYSNTNVRSACDWNCKVFRQGILNVGAVTESTNFAAPNGTTANVVDESGITDDPATFNVTIVANNVQNISVATGGSGYNIGNLIRISASSLSGTGAKEGIFNVPVATLISGSAVEEYRAFFSEDDEPFIADSGGTTLISGAQEWSSSSTYTENQVVKKKFTVASSVPVNKIKRGKLYEITTAGNPTNTFTDLGAANNSVGTVFTATSDGAGTPTAGDVKQIAFVHYMAKTSISADAANEPIEKSANWGIVRPFKVYSAVNDAHTFTADPVDARRSSYVYHNDNIWRVVVEGRKNQLGVPSNANPNWTTGDICSKLLSGCKARYGMKVIENYTTDSVDFMAAKVSNFDTGVVLPFGGFPGTRKFK